jgi:phosphinothricin acetyltransferase
MNHRPISPGLTTRIRLAVFDDVQPILAISNDAAMTSPANFAIEPEPLEAWQSAWRSTNDRHPWLVAMDEAGTVIGFAKSSPWKARAAYAWAAEVSVYIRPDHHGRGIGKALYERVFDLLRAQGYHLAIGGITLPNPVSVRLHESFGMRHVGTFQRNGWKFGAWHDVGYWSMPLQPADVPPGPIRPVAEVAHLLTAG